MRVLIAEDDPVSRTVLRKTLERWGTMCSPLQMEIRLGLLFSTRPFRS